MRVIGTAGHVDHGKSTLIAALTGTHPDRLKEEQEREITIELGFGWMTLPDGQEVGIVDVPGHIDFIGNMLAGVGGIDAALLVIAADEGVMPQTREHLAILDLLQIPKGLVVLTKTDLVDDPDWLDLVEADIRAALAGSAMATSPVVRVSARTGSGLPALLQALAALLRETPARADLGRARLPVDRVFSMPGFGTVVTGTLSDGHLSIGDEVQILPAGLTGRVRGLQTHKQKEERALPGSRTAVNLSGVSMEQVQRGDVLAAPGRYQPTRRVDARLRLLADLAGPLKHGLQVKVFSGSAETLGTLRLLDAESLPPGGQGWAQLELRDPLVLVRGDRCILRRPSPGETLGGVLVMDANPSSRHKRFDADVLGRLEKLMQGTPADLLLQASLALGAATLRETLAKARLEPEAAAQALRECLESGALIALESPSAEPAADSLVIAAAQFAALQEGIRSALQTYHASHALRRGMPREELKSRLKLAPRLFNALLKQAQLQDGGAWLALPGHTVRFSAAQQAGIDALLAKFASAPYAPPSVKECQAEVGEDVYSALVELGELVQVSAEVVFARQAYAQMTLAIREKIGVEGEVTAAGVRDLFGTSRKFVLALLEHLDAIGVTIRDGDARRLRKP